MADLDGPFKDMCMVHRTVCCSRPFLPRHSPEKVSRHVLRIIFIYGRTLVPQMIEMESPVRTILI